MSRIAKPENLTKKDLATRWKVSVRSVERIVKQYNLMPVDFFGRQPEFHPADVAGMEERRKRDRLMRRTPLHVITVKQAKALAKGPPELEEGNCEDCGRLGLMERKNGKLQCAKCRNLKRWAKGGAK